jgi:RNA polymerase sigma factor for flagellar operon FliA
VVFSDVEMRAALEAHKPLLRREVRRMLRRVAANVLPEDLYAAARVGLWLALGAARDVAPDDAQQRYGHRRYLVMRMRGAMLDELRAQDWLPRRQRALARDTRVVGLEEQFVEPATLPETARVDARMTVTRVLGLLGPRDRFVLCSIYLRGLLMTEVGAIMGVSEPRVSQLHARALARLREMLDPEAA